MNADEHKSPSLRFALLGMTGLFSTSVVGTSIAPPTTND